LCSNVSDSGRAVVELHIEHAEFFTTPDLGMRMTTCRARAIRSGSSEIASAVLAVVTDREHFHQKLGALGHGAASDIGEGMAETIQVEHTTAANCKVNSQDVAGSVAICCLVHDGQDVISDFALVHAFLASVANSATE
jgi:hypothetical protein